MSNAEQPPLITECPNCHTRFRVSDSQLQIAHGRVRCGACLAVFPGMDHMIVDDEAQARQPERRQQGKSTLEAVLSELSEDQARSFPDEQPAAGKAGKKDKVAEELLNGYDPAFVKRDSAKTAVAESAGAVQHSGDTAQPAADVAKSGADSDQDSDQDWMEQSIDTTSMDKVTPTGSAARPSLDDALNDEEALRWWLADELTGEAPDSPGYNTGPVPVDEAPAAAAEAFDLEEMILAAAEGSTEKLEALLNELPNEVAPAVKEELAAVKSGRAKDSAHPGALDLAPPQLSIEVPKPPVPATPNIPERIMAALTRRKNKPASAADEPLSTTEVLLADGGLATEQFAALGAAARAEAASHGGQAAPGQTAGATHSVAADAGVAHQGSDTSAEPSWLTGLLSSGNAMRAGTSVATLLLVAQVFYHQFDSWVAQPNLRPIYGAACSVLGCELPPRRSIAELSSRQLVVRQHPDEADLLLVDVLLVNEAEFDQPFPLLEMNFMNARGEIEVTYEVAADQYLGGELRDAQALMPPRTPVHIDFEVPDPGADAPSYQLAIR